MLGITVTNTWGLGLLDEVVEKRGYGLDVATSRQKDKCKGTFPNAYKLLTLAISTWGDYVPDFHDIVKETGRLNASRSQKDVANDEEGAHIGCEVGRAVTGTLDDLARNILLPNVAPRMETEGRALDAKIVGAKPGSRQRGIEEGTYGGQLGTRRSRCCSGGGRG